MFIFRENLPKESNVCLNGDTIFICIVIKMIMKILLEKNCKEIHPECRSKHQEAY